MGDFNNVFKSLRIASGLTQEELAQKLHISRSRVGMYETGARQPDYETLEAIADFFNVDMDYLLGRSTKTTVIPNTGYYFNPETAEVAQKVFENKELRLLFDAAKDSSPEDIRTIHQMLLALKRKEKNE
ncbi:transcriptional regulator with XRE-family HTH domain [Moryella indoligenes]|uniref:Transcriptional regulator with XRE-family HTH domain n=1 Tax=Moryella indoligenes TaxID=371674 RepID=A0AAE3VBB5_9FIRM|nr:helix-turn-helix transcriptional regulator [Moryella indoligenes]MDQ0153156.1 transcriptional regulator with XRE-family HTH domain [Moryella indoligenes]